LEQRIKDLAVAGVTRLQQWQLNEGKTSWPQQMRNEVN
jgi:hypothetical protein